MGKVCPVCIADLALMHRLAYPTFGKCVWGKLLKRDARKQFMSVEYSFPVEAAATVKKPPLLRWLKEWRWFTIFVAAPTVLATVYYGLIASDVYVSESRFVIKSPDQKRAQSSTLANLIQTTGLSGGQEQTNEVLGFIHSRDALKALEQTIGIRSKYASSSGDFLSRFPTPLLDESFESLYKYYGKMTEARLDSETGMAVITTKAFTARDSYEINKSLLLQSEAMVNRLNARANKAGIAEAQRQVDAATARAKRARASLARYRNAQSLLDPAKQAGGVMEIANELIAQRAVMQAQLDQIVTLTPKNPSIPALRNRISAISAQIASQNGQVVGTDSGIASKLGGYEDLMVEQEFATESMNVANASLVQARAEAQRQQFYLERVVDSNLPDAPLLPKRLMSILVVFATATCLYFIGWMLMVGVLEHAPED